MWNTSESDKLIAYSGGNHYKYIAAIKNLKWCKKSIIILQNLINWVSIFN